MDDQEQITKHIRADTLALTEIYDTIRQFWALHFWLMLTCKALQVPLVDAKRCEFMPQSMNCSSSLVAVDLLYKLLLQDQEAYLHNKLRLWSLLLSRRSLKDASAKWMACHSLFKLFSNYLLLTEEI